jgi:hypothetical protein
VGQLPEEILNRQQGYPIGKSFGLIGLTPQNVSQFLSTGKTVEDIVSAALRPWEAVTRGPLKVAEKSAGAIESLLTSKAPVSSKLNKASQKIKEARTAIDPVYEQTIMNILNPQDIVYDFYDEENNRLINFGGPEDITPKLTPMNPNQFSQVQGYTY